MKKPDYRIPAPSTDKWEWGQRWAELQDTVSPAYLTRLINEQSRASRTTVDRWIGRVRALKAAVPYDVARNALLDVTGGDGLVSETERGHELPGGYVAALRKYPVPPEGTSYEDCRDWAMEVEVAASRHVGLTIAPESWQIQSAKARFSEVFRRARSEGPQRITRQGKEGVVMVAEEQYDQLVGKSHQPKSLVQFFRQSPLMGVELDLERDRDAGRDIDL